MSKVFTSIRFDDALRTNIGSAFNLHSDVLVLGVDGYNDSNDTANLFLGSTTVFMKASFDGDTMSLGATSFLFEIGGTERMRVDADGSVGIGTNDPTQTLDVNGDVLVQGGDLFLVDTNEKISSDGTDMTLHVNGAERVRILSTGNVGINTTSPDRKLHVHSASGDTSYGQIHATSSEATGRAGFSMLHNSVGGNFARIFMEPDGDMNVMNQQATKDIILSTNSLEKVRILSSGEVGIGTDAPNQTLDVNGDAIVRGGDLYIATTGEYISTPTTDQLAIGAGGSERIRIDENGYVGINNTNPTAFIDGVLSQNAQTALRLCNTDGGAGAYVEIAASNDGAYGTRLLTFGTGFTTAGAYVQDGGLVGSQSNLDGGLAVAVESSNVMAHMRFYTGGSGEDNERMRITQDGNVGLGVTAPTEQLEVNGKTVTTTFQMTTGGTVNYVLTSDASGNATWAAPQDTTSIQDADGDTKIEVETIADEDVIRMSTAGSERLTVGATGFVGIGSAEPTQTLDVNGDVLVQGGDLYLTDTNEKIASDGTDMTLHVNGAEQVRILANGNVGIGTDAPGQTLDVDGDAVVRGGDLFLVDTSEKIASDGTDMTFHVDSGERVRILANGNVGIGTDSPGKELDVNGDVRVRGGDVCLSLDDEEKISSDGSTVSLTAGNQVRLTVGTTINLAENTFIQGDLTVNGDLTYIASQTIQVEDAMIMVGATNTTSDTLDLGLYAQYNDGSLKYAGIVRDSGDNGIWHLFESTTEPGTTQATLDNHADLHLRVLEVDSGVGYNGDLQFLSGGVSGTETMRLESSTGNLGIGTNDPSQKLHVQGDALVQGGDLYLVDTNEAVSSDGTDMFFTVNATEHVRIKADGKVGLGVSAPTEELEVGGSVLVQDKLTSTNFQMTTGGTLNYVLTSDAAGNATWAAPQDTTSVQDGDGDTKIEVEASPDEDIIRFTTASSERMTIGSTGNVGIGSNEPTQTLDVNGDVLVQGGDLYLTDTDEKIASDGTDLTLHVGGSERVKVDANGDVGIGTADPTQKLFVYSSDATDSQVIVQQAQAGSDAGLQINQTAADGVINLRQTDTGLAVLETLGGANFQFGVSGTDNDFVWNTADLTTEAMRLTHDGKLGVGVNDPTQQLHVAGDAQVTGDMIVGAELYVGSTANIIAESASNELTFSTNLVERVRIDANGNVGVGVSAPTEELEVGGSVLVQDKLTSTNFQMTTGGTLNYVLTSDALGNATWAAPQDTTSIQDADGDTKIEVENIADEDVIRMSTAGSERMTLGATGFVGIGSAEPTQTLDVNGDALLQGGDLFLVDTNNKVSSASNELRFDSNGAQQMVIDSSGNVGIGSATPGNKLDVIGNVLVEGADGFNAGGEQGIVNLGNSNYKVLAEFGHGVRLESTDNVSINIDSDNTASTQYFDIETSDTSLMRVLETGNVGIGITNPSQKLDVNGNMLVQSGTVYLTDTDDSIASDGTDITLTVGGAVRETVGVSGVTLHTDTVIQGNLTVNGQTTTVESTVLSVNDPLISLADGNAANTLDIGFYGTYNDGVQKYGGLARDASDAGIWHLFEATAEPTTTVTVSEHANLHVHVLEVEAAVGYNGDLQFLSGGVSGTETMRLESSSGNLGIGTNDPSQKLHVQGDALVQGGDLYLVDTNEAVSSDGTDMFFTVNATAHMWIKADGKVGLGVSAPTEELEVGGSVLVQDKLTSTNFQMTAGATNNYILSSDAAGNATWIDPNTNAANLIEDADGDTKIEVEQSADEDKIRFTVQGGQKMIIDTDGNVGIGVTAGNLDQLLEVNGDAHIDGNLRTAVETVTSSTTLDHTHSVVLVDASGGAVTITLPQSHDGTAEPNFKGSVFHVVKTDTSSNAVTIALAGSDVLDGSTDTIDLLTQDDRVSVLNTGGGSSVGRWYLL